MHKTLLFVALSALWGAASAQGLSLSPDPQRAAQPPVAVQSPERAAVAEVEPADVKDEAVPASRPALAPNAAPASSAAPPPQPAPAAPPERAAAREQAQRQAAERRAAQAQAQAKPVERPERAQPSQAPAAAPAPCSEGRPCPQATQSPPDQTVAVRERQQPEREQSAREQVQRMQPAAPIVSPVVSGSSGVNPFTGKALSVEQAQRQVELLRMQTQVLEEQLKQVGLAEEMKTVPARKAVELASAATALQKEDAAQRQILAAAQAAEQEAAEREARARAAARAASAPAPRPVAKPVKADTAKPAPSAPVVTLASVIRAGEYRSAVFSVNGASMVVRDGESTPFGVARILDSGEVRLGERPYAVNSYTLARATLSDRAAVLGAAPLPAAPPVQASLPPVLPPAPDGERQGTDGKPLPALQLPPGVQLMRR